MMQLLMNFLSLVVNSLILTAQTCLFSVDVVKFSSCLLMIIYRPSCSWISFPSIISGTIFVPRPGSAAYTSPVNSALARNAAPKFGSDKAWAVEIRTLTNTPGVLIFRGATWRRGGATRTTRSANPRSASQLASTKLGFQLWRNNAFSSAVKSTSMVPPGC